MFYDCEEDEATEDAHCAKVARVVLATTSALNFDGPELDDNFGHKSSARKHEGIHEPACPLKGGHSPQRPWPKSMELEILAAGWRIATQHLCLQAQRVANSDFRATDAWRAEMAHANCMQHII